MEPVRHVFLIEDNAGDILLIRQVLEALPIPIRLHVARDGDQALFMLAEGLFEPELIVLDLNLPKVSGSWFLAQSKPQVPVVVFSSSSNTREIRKVLELGAKAFVEKSTDIEEYAGQVSQIINEWLPSGFAAA